MGRLHGRDARATRLPRSCGIGILPMGRLHGRDARATRLCQAAVASACCRWVGFTGGTPVPRACARQLWHRHVADGSASRAGRPCHAPVPRSYQAAVFRFEGGLSAVANFELTKNIRHVILYSAFGEEESICDLTIALAL